MRRPAEVLDDRGSASLEFIVGGMLLLVPVVYLIVSLGLIQEQTLGIEAAARHAARSIAHGENAITARNEAEQVIDAVVVEYGLDPSAVEVTISCIPTAPICPTAGSTVVVTVSSRVQLPLVPPVLGLDETASVPIEASAAQKVSRFWGAR